MTKVIIAALVLVAVLAAGCGDTEKTASEKEQLVAVVSEYLDAVYRGDATTACADLTPRGQHFQVTGAKRFRGFGTVTDCESAVEAAGEYIRENDIPSSDVETFNLDDASVTGRDPKIGQVNCKFRGAYLLREVDGEWLIYAPGCVD